MKNYIKKYGLFSFLLILISSCGEANNDDHGHDHGPTEHSGGHHHEKALFLSKIQMKNLDLQIGSLSQQNMGSYVLTNGQLEVPPQNEASVTAIIGSNISSILVIEGDKISKGQIIAYLSHPKIIDLQSQYIKAWSESTFLDKELARQEKLRSEEVNSGKELELAKSKQITSKAAMNGLKAQLQLLGISVKELEMGKIQNNVPVKSPIDGFIRAVKVKTGQFVAPQTEMFEIVNIEHIHADFMVYEKDIHKVKKGQKVKFRVESLPDTELDATIYSVGKAFEQNPKAVHLHAEIENKQGLLIPGMYAQGKINISEDLEWALPEDAITEYENEFYIFLVKEKKDVTEFKPIKIKKGRSDQNWIGIINLNEKLLKSKFAISKAYDLMSELKKEEAEHSH